MYDVKIDGILVSDKVFSINMAESIGRQNNTFSFTTKDINDLYTYKEVVVSENSNKRLAGMVLEQSFSEKGIKVAEFQCVDYNYILQNRVVAATYQNKTVDYILEDLILKYAKEFTLNNLRTCTITIESIAFNYVSLSEAIQRVLEYAIGWYYYVDANRDFHLFNSFETTGKNIVAVNGKYPYIRNTLKVRYSAQNVTDRVWIVGSKQASSKEISQYLTGDGQQRYFTLAYEPNYTKVYVDGVLKDSALESNDNSDQDFLINKKNKVIFIPDYRTPFTGTIKVSYKPTIQVIDYFENTKSQNPYPIEKIIKNKDITDKTTARQFGKAEIKRRSKPKTFISFTTREDMKIGQKCYVSIPEYNIDGSFLVLSVNTNITPSDTVRSVELEEI